MSVITNAELFKKHMTALHDPIIYENSDYPSGDDLLECVSPTWETNKPSKDGWYLYKEGRYSPEPVLVSDNATMVLDSDHIQDYLGEWCYLEELA